MTLAEVMDTDRVFASVRAVDKTALLNDLARRSAAALGLPVQAVAGALAAREALGSTGVGAGIAVPHARIDGISKPAGFFARLERSLGYDAIDGKPVDLVFLLLSPAQGDADHLGVLAAASRRLRDPAVADAIRAADSAQAIRSLLVNR